MLQDLLFDYTLRTVALGATVLGLVSGALGTYAVLRQQSLVGDAVSHAALPGIALAFVLTGSKAPLVLMLGAAATGWLAMLLVLHVTTLTRVKYDSALGTALSVFFGAGLVLLTIIQRRPDATQAGLDTFLFGQAATLLARDVLTMAALSAVVLGLIFCFWKELKLLSFDPDFAVSIGLPVRTLDVLLTTLLVVAIVIGLQTVGVVLMSAMLIAPAAAARQWTDRMGVMIVLSAAFGGAAGVAGAVISSTTAQLPTGPTIVIAVTVIVVVSLLLAPNRGLVWRWARAAWGRQQLSRETVLLDLYALSTGHRDAGHAHRSAVLQIMRGASRRELDRTLGALDGLGWARSVGEDRWALTPEGLAEARRLTSVRAPGTEPAEAHLHLLPPAPES